MAKQRVIEFEVDLLDPIPNVATPGGGAEEGTKVLLKAPSAKNRRPTSKLKSLYNSTVAEIQREATAKVQFSVEEIKELREAAKDLKATGSEEKDDDSTINAQDVINYLTSVESKEFDILERAFGYLKELLENGCGSVLGAQITDPIFAKFSYDDLENLLGSFVATFLAPSRLPKPGGTD